MPRPPTPRAEHSKTQLMVYGAIAVGAIALVVLLIAYFVQQRAIPGKIAEHIAQGDRYREEVWYDRAIKEYETALALAPAHVEAKQRLVTAMRQNLSLKGFGPGSAVDHSLRADYDRLELVAPADVEAALARLRELYVQAPALKDDAGVLWDEALILKVAGKPAAALAVFERLHRLRPKDLDVMAELGLLRAWMANREGRPLAGLDLLRTAIAEKPQEPRFRLYFARSLHEAYECTSKTATPKPARREVCGAAKREYLRAEELASGDDIWSRRIKLRAGKEARQPGLH